VTAPLPRALEYRLERLRSMSGTNRFHPYSTQMLGWLKDDPVFGPLAIQAAQEYSRLSQQAEGRLDSHLQEAGQLLELVQQHFPEQTPAEGWQREHGIPTVKYHFSLQRAADLAARKDLLAMAQPMTTPKFGEDRTPAGKLIEILWNTLKSHLERNESLLDRPEIEHLFLQLDYLQSRQAAVLAELQIHFPAMAGNALVELVRHREALITTPQRYASLSERAQAIMAIPHLAASVLVAIRQEAEGSRDPDPVLQTGVIGLWEIIFNDFADRLDRGVDDRHKPLLETTRLLIMTANTPEEPLWVEHETQAIRDALYAAKNREALELLYNTATTGPQIMPMLDRHKPHILHLSCHGTPHGLTLVDSEHAGVGEFYDAALTMNDLKLGGPLRLVVFMACQSAPIARAVVEHADAAIGMNDDIDDSDAPVFSRALYGALAENLSLQAAFDRACHAVQVTGGGSHIPELYVREGLSAKDMFFGVPS